MELQSGMWSSAISLSNLLDIIGCKTNWIDWHIPLAGGSLASIIGPVVSFSTLSNASFRDALDTPHRTFETHTR